MAVQTRSFGVESAQFHVILITTLLAVLHHHCCGQIHYLPSQGCNTLPAQCRCEHLLVACTCIDSQTSLNNTNNSNSSGGLVLGPTVFSLRQVVAVIGCANVTVPSGAVSTSLVHTLRLVNLTRLTLESGALLLRRRQRLELALINVTVNNLPPGLFDLVREDRAFATANQTRRIDIPKVQLVVNNSRIGRLSRGVFSGTRIHDLIIANNSIGAIERGFLDNIVEGSIAIEGNEVTAVERDALVNRKAEVGPGNFIMRYNNFIGVETPFVVATTNYDIEVSNNSFPALDGPPWQLEAREDVAIEDNTFVNVPPYGLALTAGARLSFTGNRVGTLHTNAFAAIRPEVDSTLVLLSRNRFLTTEPGSLALPARLLSEAVIIRGNVFEQPCSCNTSMDIMRALGFTNLTLRQAIESNKLNQPWLSLSLCQLLGNDDFDYIQVSLYHSRSCVETDITTTVFLVCFACVLILLACCVIVAWRRLRKKHLAPTQSTSVQSQYPDGDLSWSRGMPKRIVYRETELRVMFQKAANLRGHSLGSNSDADYTVRGYDNMAQVEEYRKEKERRRNQAKNELEGTSNKVDKIADERRGGQLKENDSTKTRWKSDGSEDSNVSVVDFEAVATASTNDELQDKKAPDIMLEDKVESNLEPDINSASQSMGKIFKIPAESN